MGHGLVRARSTTGLRLSDRQGRSLRMIADLFLNSTGRIGRVRFLVGAGVLLAVWAAFDILVPGPTRGWALWIVAPALLYAGACVLSQRLHDRGRSGWWCWPILLAFALAWPWPEAWSGWAAAGVLLVAAVDLFLLPGQARFNRHGAPPGAAGRHVP